MKYNLTFWQKALLIPIWLIWLTRPKYVRKTWHEVKKGMENHEHTFEKPVISRGFLYWHCIHEGCNMCKPDETFYDGIGRKPK